MLENNKDDESKRELETQKRQLREDLVKVLKIPSGRRFIWDLLQNKCRISDLVYDDNQYLMNFNEGKRAIGLNILKRILAIEPCFAMQMASEEASIKNSKNSKKGDVCQTT